MIIETRIAGIPCKINVKLFERVQGSYSRYEESAQDYYGWTELDWDVLDRRGRPAPWLERKLTADEIRRIESEIIEGV